MSEKINFAKFARLQMRGMHTIPSLLPGDIKSGVDTLVKNDFGPLGKFTWSRVYSNMLNHLNRQAHTLSAML